MKKKALKFGLAITLLGAGILLLVPLALQYFSGRMSDDGSLVTIKAAKRVCDLRFASNDGLKIIGKDSIIFWAPFSTRVWNANTGSLMRQKMLPTRAIEKPDLSPSGDFIFEPYWNSKKKQGSINLKRSDNGTVAYRLNMPPAGFNVTLSPDKSMVVGATAIEKQTTVKPYLSIGGIQAWNTKTGKPTWFAEELRSKQAFYFPQHTYTVFSPDGKVIAETNEVWLRKSDYSRFPHYRPTKLLLREAKTGRKLRDLANSLSKNGSTGGSGIHIWRFICFSPDNKWLAALLNKPGSAPSYQQTEIQIWEVATGRLEWSLNREDVDLRVAAFSPDGSRLACGGYVLNTSSGFLGGEANLWDVKTGVLLHTYQRETRADAWNCAWGAGMRNIQKAIKQIFSPGVAVTTGIPKSFPVTHLAFSPDGKRLAAADEEGVVKIWPVQ